MLLSVVYCQPCDATCKTCTAANDNTKCLSCPLSTDNLYYGSDTATSSAEVGKCGNDAGYIYLLRVIILENYFIICK